LGRVGAAGASEPLCHHTGCKSRVGMGNAGSSAVQITARAEVAFDANKAELTADFVPASREVIESDPRLFIAPPWAAAGMEDHPYSEEPERHPDARWRRYRGASGRLSGRRWPGDLGEMRALPGMTPGACCRWMRVSCGTLEIWAPMRLPAEISVVTRRDGSGRQAFTEGRRVPDRLGVQAHLLAAREGSGEKYIAMLSHSAGQS